MRASVWLARTLGLDGNPLRRASDRAEAWIRVGLLAVCLIAGPMAALAAGGWADQVRTAEPSARTVQAHAVKAVLIQKAPVHDTPATIGVAGAAWGGQVWVQARWKSTGGLADSGDVLAPEGLPAGTVVTVWLNASGRVTSPPPKPGQAGADAALAALAVLAVVAIALLAVLRLIKWFLNRRRLAAWEAAWSAVGPRWTGHMS